MKCAAFAPASRSVFAPVPARRQAPGPPAHRGACAVSVWVAPPPSRAKRKKFQCDGEISATACRRPGKDPAALGMPAPSPPAQRPTAGSPRGARARKLINFPCARRFPPPHCRPAASRKPRGIPCQRNARAALPLPRAANAPRIACQAPLAALPMAVSGGIHSPPQQSVLAPSPRRRQRARAAPASRFQTAPPQSLQRPPCPRAGARCTAYWP